MNPVAAVILAAGVSKRMGRPKQLLDWGGRPLVRVAVENVLAATTIADVVVVVGNAAEDVSAALDGLPVTIAANADYAKGQSTSLHVGITALDERVRAALVLLGDQPFVSPTIIDALVAAWRERGMQIVAPVYAGQRGNPVLFDSSVFPELLATTGDQGARAILQADQTRIQLVPFDDLRPLEDIDTPDDYARLAGNRM